jgi:hypothetical protein
MTFVRATTWNDDDCGPASWSDAPGTNQVLAGFYEINLSDCGKRYKGIGAVKFGIAPSDYSALAQAAVVKATLTFALDDTDYAVSFPPASNPNIFTTEYTTYVTGNLKPFCPVNLAKAKIDWTGLVNAGHLNSSPAVSPALDSPSDSTMVTAVYGLYGASVDVTSIVQDWLKNPTANNGFVILPDWSRMGNVFYPDTQAQACVNYLGGFQVDVQYYAPPAH